MAMNSATAVSTVLRIPLDLIEPGPNARGPVGDVDELAASLRAVGQELPVIVEQLPEGRFRLIDGHRRHAAANQAGVRHLDAVVRRPPGDAERILRQLAISTHTKAFDPMAEAAALHRLMFHERMTREEIARLVGRSPGWVRDRIALVHLTPTEQSEVRTGRLSVAEATLRLKGRREARDGVEGRPAAAPASAKRDPGPAPAAQPSVRHCATCTCGGGGR